LETPSDQRSLRLLPQREPRVGTGAGGNSSSERLASAIERDYERRKGTTEPLETLDQNARAFLAAATQLLTEARQVMERVGPLQEIGMRLARIESAIGGRVAR
jgi:hypothetical protein